MGIEKSGGIKYPEGLDEKAMSVLLTEVIAGVDRTKLMHDGRMGVPRHPFLEAQLGSRARNEELHYLLHKIAWFAALVEPHLRAGGEPLLDFLEPGDAGSTDLPNAELAEKILIENSKDPAKMQSSLANLKTAITDVSTQQKSRDDQVQVYMVVNYLAEKKLPQPSNIDRKILYAAVVSFTQGKTKEEIFRVIDDRKSELLGESDDAEHKRVISHVVMKAKVWAEGMLIFIEELATPDWEKMGRHAEVMKAAFEAEKNPNRICDWKIFFNNRNKPGEVEALLAEIDASDDPVALMKNKIDARWKEKLELKNPPTPLTLDDDI